MVSLSVATTNVPGQVSFPYCLTSSAYFVSGFFQDLSESVSLIFEREFSSLWLHDASVSLIFEGESFLFRLHDASEMHIVNAIIAAITFFIGHPSFQSMTLQLISTHLTAMSRNIGIMYLAFGESAFHRIIIISSG